VDVLPAGAAGLNFGWRAREGLIQTSQYPNESPVTPETKPIFNYSHSTLGYCVTGGYVYRGKAIPQFLGHYIFCDYGTGRFWSTARDGANYTTTEISSDIQMSGVSSFAEDSEGELYIITLSGTIYKIVSAAPPAPEISETRLNESGEFILTFNALAGQTYILEKRQDFSANSSWESSATIDPQASDTSMTITNMVSGEGMYFRLRAP
jgi:hypothetical protein